MANCKKLCMLAFLLGFLLGGWFVFLYKPSTTNLKITSDGKIQVRARQGDVVNWVPDDANTIGMVEFDYATPCSNLKTKTLTNSCVVNQDHGEYIYNCDQGACPDPGFEAQPSRGPSGQLGQYFKFFSSFFAHSFSYVGQTVVEAQASPSPQPYIACDDNGIVTIQPMATLQFKYKDPIRFSSNSGDFIVTLTGDDGMTCQGGQTQFTEGKQTCRVAAQDMRTVSFAAVCKMNGTPSNGALKINY